MRKYQILLAGALAVTAGSAYAAMGPTQFGLPINWAMTSTVGYGVQNSVAGNGASAMCVECHTVSPSDRILQVSVVGGNVAGVARTNADTLASHFVMNAGSGIGATNSGGGFLGGMGVRDGGEYLQGGPWAAGATYLSKFSNGATLTSAYEGGVTPANAGMICESCHNIINNVLGADHGGAADNDLLLGAYEDNVNDAICRGCHANAEAAVNNVFHGNDNLASFSSPPQRKRHHVLSGDTLAAANYGTTGVSSIMWAPSFSNRLSGTWCTSKYASGVTPVEILDGAIIAFRGLCNVAGSGSRSSGDPVSLGDIEPTAADEINCSNCHRPHNAATYGGAFILRAGKNVAAADGPAVAYPTGNTNPTHAAGKLFQVRRQSDIATGGANGDYATKKVYADYRNLCAGCHYGY